MDSDSDDQLLEEDEFPDIAMELSFANRLPPKPEPRAKYRDYHSIDWLRELSRDKGRHARIERLSRSGRLLEKLKSTFDKSSGWLVVLLIGTMAGCCAGVVDITTKWLADIRLGVCRGSMFLNKEQCCWSSTVPVPISDYDAVNCSEWNDWSQIFGAESDSAKYVADYFVYVLLALIFGSSCGLVTKYFAPYATGSGIPEVKTILSGFIIHGYLGVGTLIGKTLSLPLAVGAGLSLGKEGPLVHVASCCGNAIARKFPKYKFNEAKRREMLSAAAAAGVSVAFGAPIGGVLFSLEEVSYYFPLKTLYRSFLCALTAAFVLRSINPFGTQHLVMFYSQYDEPWYWFELVGFVVVGVLGGLYGAAFNKLNLAYCHLRKTSRLAHFPFVEVVVISVVTALLCFPNQYTKMPQADLIAMLFKTCKFDRQSEDICNYNMVDNVLNATSSSEDMIVGTVTPQMVSAIWKLCLAMVLYAVLTVMTFGMKVPSGLFIPSMVVGAVFGRLVGLGLQQLVYLNQDSAIWSNYCGKGQVCVNPGLYAMVGAAASLSGVTRMTVSLVVIMYELTGGLLYIVPLMVATMTAKWVADGFGHEGIYDAHIRLNNYPFLDGKSEYSYSTLACDVMRPRPEDGDSNLEVITAEGQTISQLEELVKTSPYYGFPVVVSRQCMRLVGYVTAQDLQLAVDQARLNRQGITSESTVHFTDSVPIQKPGEPSIARLSHILDIAPMNVSDVSPMALVVEIFRKLGIRQCLVLRHGRLQGIITRKDILYHIARLHSQDPSRTLFN